MMRGQHYGGVGLTQNFEPFFELRCEEWRGKRQPGFVEDYEGRPPVEAFFYFVEEVEQSRSDDLRRVVHELSKLEGVDVRIGDVRRRAVEILAVCAVERVDVESVADMVVLYVTCSAPSDRSSESVVPFAIVWSALSISARRCGVTSPLLSVTSVSTYSIAQVRSARVSRQESGQSLGECSLPRS